MAADTKGGRRSGAAMEETWPEETETGDIDLSPEMNQDQDNLFRAR